MISNQEALTRIERVAAELADLEANTERGGLNDLMIYALSHVRTAIEDLKEDHDTHRLP